MKKLKILDKELVKNEESLNTFESEVKKVDKITKIKKKLKLYIISFIIFLISFLLYKLSLTGCERTEYECVSEERVKFFYKLGIATLFSSILFAVLFNLSNINNGFYLLSILLYICSKFLVTKAKIWDITEDLI
jgi:hypothetical protein